MLANRTCLETNAIQTQFTVWGGEHPTEFSSRGTNVIYSMCKDFSFASPCHKPHNPWTLRSVHILLSNIYKDPLLFWVCVVKFLISFVKQTFYIELVSSRLTILNQQPFIVLLGCITKTNHIAFVSNQKMKSSVS
jgi:hypothetical protein